jgi:hypothetical protein
MDHTGIEMAVALRCDGNLLASGSDLFHGTLEPSRPGTPPMHETELERERRRALVAEGLAAALTEAARRESSYLQSELQRPDWEHKTGKEGLDAALSMLRAQLGPLVTGAEGTRYTEVLRRAKALARAVEDLEGQTARGKDPRAGRR